ncbi:hypothetical protein BKA65DRAFT_556955 [Rhexocercosporidium sp. MPI-PUGE-AT-0058]|nr:hypothetical protein BKA65DRAFT_556955 [Rhexocercosporidium sp. MPI-PUGE-AT-0058]
MAFSATVQDESFDLNFASSKQSQEQWKSIKFQNGEAWPETLQSPLVWDPSDFQDEESFVYTLDEDEVIEITDALDGFKSLQLEYWNAKKHNFLLPTLGPRLEDLSVELHRGRGFFTLRGLDPTTFSRIENIVIFLGLSSYIAGRIGRQSLDAEGRMLNNPVIETYHPIYSTDALPFHSDVLTEVIALYCLSTAAAGGRSKISSSWKIYNELALTRPDILVALATDDWVHNTQVSWHSKPERPSYKRALLHLTVDGQIILNFSTHSLQGSPPHPRPAELPPLTARQLEALEVVEQLARKYTLVTTFLPGDIRFMNNFAMLHSRDPYQNQNGPPRHLLRLWLSSEENGVMIPESL